MVCPFRFTICATILIFALSSVFFHFYFSDDTVDYLLQWIPIPDKTKDWLYLHLTSPTSFPPTSTSASSTPSPQEPTNSTNPHKQLQEPLQSQTSTSTEDSKQPQSPQKTRPNRQFTRKEVPTIVKVLKYVTMGLIVYLHAELFAYQVFSTCFTAQTIRFISSFFQTEQLIAVV